MEVTKELCDYFTASIKDATKLILSQSEAISSLEQRIAEAESVIDMVEDNRKMPHQHSDYYLRLSCLSERATEYKQKYAKEER